MSAKPKLLLVDDRPENLLALEAILDPLDTELVRAGSGEEALRRLLDEEFAAILLDVQMPGLDGFQTAELIKRRERTKHVPILFLTAISKDTEHIFRGYSAGAVDYLLKPFDPSILRAKVAVFLELWQKAAEVRERDALLAEQELEALERESEVRYRSLADAMPQIVWTSDPDGELTYLNERWYELTGLAREEPHVWQDVVHPDDVAAASASWDKARRTQTPFEAEYRIRMADGVYRWFLGRAVPTPDGWVGTSTDIDERKRAEERQEFLADAGWVLGSSLDYEQTLVDVARLAVPRIADWCAVDVLAGGTIKRVAVAHVDPLKVALAQELVERYPPSLDDERGIAQVLRSCEPVLVPLITEDMLVPDRDELYLEIVRSLGLRSYMSVPLVARGEVLGAITFVTAESGHQYGEDDLAVATELARHASVAIDNAHLYRESERRGRASRALEAVADGVVLVDDDGVIRLWNTAASTITGVTEAEALGRRIDDVIGRWSEISPLIPVAGRPGERVRAETVPVEFGGRELWISGSGVGFEEGTVYAFRDLTEERALEELKADFVATVSHELRTPLAAIYGAAQTVRRKDVDIDVQIRDQLLDVIASESDRLGAIVNDLLVAGRLDAGQLPIEVERCDPVELAESVVDAARAHLPESVELELRVADGVPNVVADPGQLHQVLANLIDNAIKYSPEGGPVSLSIANGDGAIRFTVSDMGLGIPPSEHRRIFEKFYRLDPDMTRGIGGTGLGLYICRELVRRMDGKIWVESALGKGSTFVVELPAAERS